MGTLYFWYEIAANWSSSSTSRNSSSQLYRSHLRCSDGENFTHSWKQIWPKWRSSLLRHINWIFETFQKVQQQFEILLEWEIPNVLFVQSFPTISHLFQVISQIPMPGPYSPSILPLVILMSSWALKCASFQLLKLLQPLLLLLLISMFLSIIIILCQYSRLSRPPKGTSAQIVDSKNRTQKLYFKGEKFSFIGQRFSENRRERGRNCKTIWRIEKTAVNIGR